LRISLKFYEHYLRGVAASTLAGTIGLNVNIANVLGAMFTATGQDIASVHESSLGYFHLERDGKALYGCLTLPSLLIGTLGGGTSLLGQRECLDIMSCYGPDKKLRLAEIIAGFCFALDLSTWSAIANQTFTEAHMTLGRNKN
jgi:hydroxymethylglutaryl-CoA reductase (NADPH)